ncbi:hypothetical protein [Streptomyces sp. ISL-44]|uniref:hypothetical protein n=1 Tax=Streptomyces sp. ISL-44 TaxID=2819184 RepID=UPI0035AC0211
MIDAIAFKYRTGTPWMDLSEHERGPARTPGPRRSRGRGFRVRRCRECGAWRGRAGWSSATTPAHRWARSP